MIDFVYLYFFVMMIGSVVVIEMLSELMICNMYLLVSGNMFEDYGMVVKVEVVLCESGSYLFDGKGIIMLNGKVVEGVVVFEVG